MGLWSEMVASEKSRCIKMGIEFKPFTSQQREFGEWLLMNSDDIVKIGDMERVFDVVVRFIKRPQKIEWHEI